MGVLQASSQGELAAYSCRYSAPPADFSGVYAIVADGMGGHDDGEKASAAAVAYFSAALARTGNLEDAAIETNEHIATLKEAGQLASNAGCTLVACLLHGSRLSTVSIGDSYIFVQRGQSFTQENELHTRGAQLDAMVRVGEMTAEEAAKEPKRGALTCAVMGRPLTHCDYRDENYYAERYGELQEDDRIFLMSDGVLTLGLETIAEMSIRSIGRPPAKLISRMLGDIEKIGHPRQDNTTILCLQGAIAGKRRAGMPGRVVSFKTAVVAAILLLAAGGGTYALHQLSSEKQAVPGKAANSVASPEVGVKKKSDKKKDIISPEESGQFAALTKEEADSRESNGEKTASALDINKENGLLQGIANIDEWLQAHEIWIADKNHELFDKLNTTEEKVDVFLHLLYASQHAADSAMKLKAHTCLENLADKFNEDIAGTPPELLILCAYHAKMNSSQWQSFYREAQKRLKSNASACVLIIRNYLTQSIVDELARDCRKVSVDIKNGKVELSCTTDATKTKCRELAEVCEKEHLISCDDADGALRVKALMLAGGEKVNGLLSSVTPNAERPNTSLLLCCHACRSEEKDWEQKFYATFIGADKEVETNPAYDALRQLLTLQCDESLLARMPGAGNEESKAIAAQISKCYEKLPNEGKIEFLKHFYASMEVAKLAKDMYACLETHREHGTDPRPDLEGTLETWYQGRQVRAALFADMFASGSSKEILSSLDVGLRAELLSLLTLQVVASEENQSKHIKDFIAAFPSVEKTPHSILLMINKAKMDNSLINSIKKELHAAGEPKSLRDEWGNAYPPEIINLISVLVRYVLL